MCRLCLASWRVAWQIERTRPPLSNTVNTRAIQSGHTSNEKHRDRLIGDPGVVLPGVISDS